MVDGLGVHRPDHGDLVRNFPHVGDEFTHPDAALAALLEIENAGRHWKARLPARHRRDTLTHADGVRKFHVEVLVEDRLVIEQVDLGRCPVHVEVNEVLRLRGKMRESRQRRMNLLGPACHLRSHETRERHAPDLESGPLEEAPAVHQLVKLVRGIGHGFSFS